jgi:hypothetical protein
MPCLWHYIQQEKIWETVGGFQKILNPQNLFTVLWQHFAGTSEQGNLPFESGEVQEAFLRNVWFLDEPGCPPQGWQHQEQRFRELADSLPSLSHEVALETKELVQEYGRDRVNRLKALGNAIVPAVAEEIFRAMEQAENWKTR